MTKEQLSAITALLAANQLAVAHLANVVAIRNNISPEDIATSFEKTAEMMPAQIADVELIRTGLRQIADIMRKNFAGPEYEQLLSRLRR